MEIQWTNWIKHPVDRNRTAQSSPGRYIFPHVAPFIGQIHMKKQNKNNKKQKQQQPKNPPKPTTNHKKHGKNFSMQNVDGKVQRWLSLPQPQNGRIQKNKHPFILHSEEEQKNWALLGYLKVTGQYMKKKIATTTVNSQP